MDHDEQQYPGGGDEYPPGHHATVPIPRRRTRTSHSACKASVYCLLAQHNDYDAKGRRRISDATRRERSDFLLRCVEDLHGQGFKLRDITRLKCKHVRQLVRLWEERGYSASVLQKYKSYLRTLAAWAGNTYLANHLDRVVEESLSDPNRIRRIRVATEDKSWEAKGTDVQDKIEAVARDDTLVAMCLRLQAAFGLRAREAWLLDPRQAFSPENQARKELPVVRGTKGGRPRRVPITQAEQYDLLRAAVSIMAPGTRSMIPKDRVFATWQRYFYWVCEKHGISRKAGIVTHGLRHGYANRRYEAISGLMRPLVAGMPTTPDAKALDANARDSVSQELGHNRRAVTSAYLGPNGPLRNPHSTDTARQQQEKPHGHTTRRES